MGKRRTKKIRIWEDKYNKWIHLNQNRGFFKNVLSDFVSTDSHIGAGAFLAILTPVFCMSDFFWRREKQSKIEQFLNSIDPGIAANSVLLNNTQEPTFFVTLAIISLVLSLLCFASSFLLKKFRSNDVILKYIDFPKDTGKYFKYIPEHLLEEYFVNQKKIEKLKENIKKIEQMIEDKPLDEFLKDELNKQLKPLYLEKGKVEKEAERIFQKTVFIIEEHRMAKKDKLDKAEKNKNNAEALRMLNMLEGSREFVNIPVEQSLRKETMK